MSAEIKSELGKRWQDYHHRFSSYEERNKFLNYFFPKRTSTNNPGQYRANNGADDYVNVFDLSVEVSRILPKE